MVIEEKVLVREIRQNDNHSFSILWTDGREDVYRLADLQARCPCAACVEAGEGRPQNLEVSAYRVKSVGRYALKVEFSSGCSNGIFDFNQLRAMAASNGQPG